MNYQQAYTTRKTGLGNLIVNKIRSGQSLSGSVGRSASEKIKSYGTGLKESFDPLNIAKKLTFGSNLAPAILGKLTGRSADDIRYFSGGKVTKQKGKKIKSGNDYADYIAQPMFDSAVMSKMLTFMKKVEDYKTKQLETARSFHEEELLERFKRHKEVVDIFLEAINKHRTGEKVVSDKTKKQKKKLDIPLGKILLGGGAIAAIALPTIASAKVSMPDIDVPDFKLPNNFPKVDDLPDIPDLPNTLPTVTEMTTMGDVPTATKASDLMLKLPTTDRDILKSIRGRESRADYSASFGMIHGNKTKQFSSVKSPEEYSGKKLVDMTLNEVRDYQNYRNAVSPNSNAVGAYQFVQSTLFGTKDRPGGLVQRLGLSMDQKFDKKTQDDLATVLYGGNTAFLQKNGVEITPASQYMAWYLGAGHAVKVYNAIKEGKGDKLVIDVIANDPKMKAKLLTNNTELQKFTASGFASELGRRTGEGLAYAQKVEGIPTVAGETISRSSTENKDIKQVVGTQKPSVGVNISQTTYEVNNRNITVAALETYSHPLMG